MLARTQNLSMKTRRLLPAVAQEIEAPRVLYQHYACQSMRQLLTLLSDLVEVC